MALSNETMETITNSLSEKQDLYFPRKVQPSSASDRKSILLDLLSRDAAVFLERYGSKLSLEELNEFDVLKDDYEVNWHLNHIRSIISPTEEDVKLKSAKVKNRRLAYMDRLIVDGSYFSEDAMREREPYLHHEYVGKFQDISGRRMARPGERWSETLIRQAEEAILVEKIRGEQQRLGVAQSDWVGNEPVVEEREEESEEEESEEELETEDKKVGASVKSSENPGVQVDRDGSTAEPRGVDSLSLEEMTDRLEQFTHIMQEKFLLGEDHQHLDYSRIDEDETLDDHWMKEINQDAEEKYFDDV